MTEIKTTDVNKDLSQKMENGLSGHAFAKVNLFLHVTGKRPDGLHLLDSLVVFAGIGDSLRLLPDPQVSLKINGPFADVLKTEPNNIILKAFRLLQDYLSSGRVMRGGQITLTKRLPVSSGIGGGSSDAATMMKLCAQLWEMQFNPVEWRQMGLSLGADVPVCLAGQPRRMQGIGELLFKTPAIPPCWLVLVNPLVAVPTAAVFKQRQHQAFSPPAIPFPEEGWANAQVFADYLKSCRNDLMVPALELQPVIVGVLQALQKTSSLLNRMSGSGATCWGLFAHEGEARQAAAALSTKYRDWWVAAAPVLDNTDTPALDGNQYVSGEAVTNQLGIKEKSPAQRKYARIPG